MAVVDFPEIIISMDNFTHISIYAINALPVMRHDISSKYSEKTFYLKIPLDTFSYLFENSVIKERHFFTKFIFY